jgi:hypothetical protein
MICESVKDKPPARIASVTELATVDAGGRGDWISVASSGGRAANLKNHAHRVAIALALSGWRSRKLFASNKLEKQELLMLSLHLLQVSLVFVNTLMIQQVRRSQSGTAVSPRLTSGRYRRWRDRPKKAVGSSRAGCE